MAIGVVIVLNSVTIGMELSFEVTGRDSSVFGILEHAFLLVYTAELAARFYAFGVTCLRNGWVAFDFSLVSTGIIANYIAPSVLAFYGDEETGRQATGILLVLRTFRLARLARTVRLLAQFKVLWMLVRGLLSSATTMAYIFILFFLILYVFACMGLEVSIPRKGIRSNFSHRVQH